MHDAGRRALRALVVSASLAGCSLTDLDDLSAGDGGGGGAGVTGSAVGTASSSSAPSSASASTATGAGGTPATGVTSTSAQATTGGDGGATSSTGTGAEGGGGSGGEAPCLEGQICTLVDDFEDGSAAQWGAFGDCERSDDGGVLTIEAFDDAGTGHFCGYYSLAAFDLRGGEVWVAIEEITAPQLGVQTFFNVQSTTTDAAAGFAKDATSLLVNSEEMANLIVDEYDPIAHRFWRISDREGALVFSTHAGADGSGWTELAEVSAHGLDLSTVQVAVGVGTYAAVNEPGRGVFDCVNVPLDACPAP